MEIEKIRFPYSVELKITRAEKAQLRKIIKYGLYFSLKSVFERKRKSKDKDINTILEVLFEIDIVSPTIEIPKEALIMLKWTCVCIRERGHFIFIEKSLKEALPTWEYNIEQLLEHTTNEETILKNYPTLKSMKGGQQ